MPTPTTDSQNDRRKPYAQGGTPLALAVKLLPTPIANDAANQTCSPSRLGKAKAPGLTATLHRLLPTPTTSAGGSNNNSAAVRERGHGTNLMGALQAGQRQDGLLLNPRFVLEMMGFPPDWCDLTEAGMEQVRRQLRTGTKRTRGIGPETR